jgi:hypothetical protein
MTRRMLSVPPSHRCITPAGLKILPRVGKNCTISDVLFLPGDVQRTTAEEDSLRTWSTILTQKRNHKVCNCLCRSLHCKT